MFPEAEGYRAPHQVRACPQLTDAVEKLGPTAGRRKIRISASILSNPCCALWRVRESSLRRQGAKIVFQQYRPDSNIDRPRHGVAERKFARCLLTDPRQFDILLCVVPVRG
jgi:hypothetical protein